MKTIHASSAFVLLAALAVVPMHASADFVVGGDETNVDRVVPSDNVWTLLVAEPMPFMGNDTSCIATGSADALNPNAAVGGLYRFVLSLVPQPPINSPCERTVAFDNGAVQSMEEVSSTCTFRHRNGNPTLYWLARKVTAAAPALTVTDSSMTFACMNNLLDVDGEGDGGAGAGAE